MTLAALLFAAASVAAGWAVYIRQTALSDHSSYDVTWIASQASVDVGRLVERVSEGAAPDDRAAADEVELRFDIVLARFADFETRSFRAFRARDPEAASIVSRLSETLPKAQNLMAEAGRPGVAAELRSRLVPLVEDLARLTAAAHRFGLDQAEAEQAGVSSLMQVFAVLTACMTACCVALVKVLRSQNLWLFHAHQNLNRLTEELAHLADHDGLTELPNRALFSRRLVDCLAVAQRDGGSPAVLCLDLDRFKAVNDALGHAAGDALLRQVAGRLRALLPEGCLVARFGGDEFTILQAGNPGREEAQLLAARVVESLSCPFRIDGHVVEIGTSVGIALVPADGCDAARLLSDADSALYHAKRSGAGTWRLFGDDDQVIRSTAA